FAPPGRLMVVFVKLAIAVLPHLRDKYAGTWNDYWLLRWRFRREVSAMAEIHRRTHLDGDRWAPGGASMRWAGSSLRESPSFDQAWRDISGDCERCKAMSLDQPMPQMVYSHTGPQLQQPACLTCYDTRVVWIPIENRHPSLDQAVRAAAPCPECN